MAIDLVTPIALDIHYSAFNNLRHHSINFLLKANFNKLQELDLGKLFEYLRWQLYWQQRNQITPKNGIIIS